METTYFDTADGFLSRRKWMLRLRRENGASVCTLKTPLPDGSRGEWEAEADSLRAALPAMAAQGAPEELAKLDPADLKEVCGARFTRLCREMTYPGGSAELALDRGWLLSGEKRLPLQELELELKAGSDGAFRRFAAGFLNEYPLEPEPRSKFARARGMQKE